MRESDFEAVRQGLRVLELLVPGQALLIQACQCSVLYWFRLLLQVYFRQVEHTPTHPHISSPFSLFSHRKPTCSVVGYMV